MANLTDRKTKEAIVFAQAYAVNKVQNWNLNQVFLSLSID